MVYCSNYDTAENKTFPTFTQGNWTKLRLAWANLGLFPLLKSHNKLGKEFSEPKHFVQEELVGKMLFKNLTISFSIT